MTSKKLKKELGPVGRIPGSRFAVPFSVGLFTFLLFLPALWNEFVSMDDDAYIYENTFIRSFDGRLLKASFFQFHASNWHPLTWLSHAVDYAVWGLNPLGHHLTNNVLHAANAFIVVLLAVRLLEYRSYKTHMTYVAAVTTGLLFGIHPLHVESAAWVSERKDLLCALFFLLSILSYTSYSSYKTYKTYFMTLGFFVLALLSKPMAVTLPAVLLLLDWHPLGRIPSISAFRGAFVEKIPFFGLSLGSSVMTILAQYSGGSLVLPDTLPLSDRLLVGMRSLVLYLWSMVLPVDLSPVYAYPQDISLLSLEYLLPVLLVAGVTAGAAAAAGRQRLWPAAWGYYLITLLPVLGLIQVGRQPMADRYTYLPSLGPFLVIGLMAAWLYEKGETSKERGPVLRLLKLAIAVSALIFLSYVTVKQIGAWRNSLALWNYVIEREPERIPSAYNQRGSAYYEKGQYDRAIADYSIAIALEPETYFKAYNNRGAAYNNKGLFDKAVEDFNKAIAINPRYAEAYNNRGIAYDQRGLSDRAIDDFGRAIAADPESDKAYNNRGAALYRKGLADMAIEDFSKAIAINPGFDRAYNNRGVAYDEKDMSDRAIEDFNKAITINPGYYEAYRNRGFAYFLNGRYDMALESYNKAIELRQDDAEVYINRGHAYLKAGNKGLAVPDLRRGCESGDENSCRTLRDLLKN